jgi:hypothetical protein
MDGALGNRTTVGDLMLAQSEGMKPQNFLQLAHGQPLLCQLGVSTFQWSPVATAALRRHSKPGTGEVYTRAYTTQVDPKDVPMACHAALNVTDDSEMVALSARTDEPLDELPWS